MALSWFMERASKSEQQRSAATLSALGSQRATVPMLWYTEIANACLVAEHRKLVSSAQTADFLTRLAAMPIRPDPAEPQSRRDAIIGLGRKHGLTAYDATYLELAMRLGQPLATFDPALARAAAATGVSVV